MTVTGVSVPSAEFVVRAPGRVNLIGEHTDYNDGFVLPIAIDASVRIAVRRRSDRRVRLFAADLGETAEFDLDAPPATAPRFAEYVIGVAEALLATGRDLAGFDGRISGDLPIGAGLSSSAALSVAAALAFAGAAAFSLEPLETARIARRAENDRVGVPCGIMDPLASAAGVAGHALLVDCRGLTIGPVPMPPDVAVVVLDTGTRRGLVDSEYAARREQCVAAARALGVAALRDVTPERLERDGARWTDLVRRRARHVVSENARTLRAAAAFATGDGAAVGKLLDESHASLRDDFEVSSPALDAIVDVARADPACLGARLTGAGFGGAAVALVRAGDAERFATAVGEGYRRRTGAKGRVFRVVASAGAEVTRPGSASDP